MSCAITIDPHGLSTWVLFEYGPTINYGSVTPAQSHSGNTYQNVAANISGLTARTTYHFRAIITNSAHVVIKFGPDKAFTTP